MATFRDMVDDLTKYDPEEQNPEAQHLIKQARKIIETHERDAINGLALTCRSNPARPDEALKAGMPQAWIILNWSKRDQVTQQPWMKKAIALEETAHLLSKLSEFREVLPNKWPDEKMARVLAFGMNIGHSPEDDGYEEAVKLFNADGFLRLYRGITREAQDKKTLLRMFFGVEPPDSAKAAKMGQILSDFSIVGEILDSGIRLEQLEELI